jgi:hypothetical protein
MSHMRSAQDNVQAHRIREKHQRTAGKLTERLDKIMELEQFLMVTILPVGLYGDDAKWLK